MRFEEPVSNLLDRYPELRLYDREVKFSHVSHQEVADGIARGRRLHAQFCRRAAKAVIAGPAVAIYRTSKQLIASATRKFNTDQSRRVTIKALSALDDRMLRDIGIERGDIPYVAASLPNSKQRDESPKIEPTELPYPDEAFVTARAA